MSFILLSLNGVLSFVVVHDCFSGLYFGMRLDVARALVDSEVLFDSDGRDGAGEPAERGCDIQSSERESSHACSIVIDYWRFVVSESKE